MNFDLTYEKVYDSIKNDERIVFLSRFKKIHPYYYKYIINNGYLERLCNDMYWKPRLSKEQIADKIKSLGIKKSSELYGIDKELYFRIMNNKIIKEYVGFKKEDKSELVKKTGAKSLPELRRLNVSLYNSIIRDKKLIRKLGLKSRYDVTTDKYINLIRKSGAEDMSELYMINNNLYHILNKRNDVEKLFKIALEGDYVMKIEPSYNKRSYSKYLNEEDLVKLIKKTGCKSYIELYRYNKKLYFRVKNRKVDFNLKDRKEFDEDDIIKKVKETGVKTLPELFKCDYNLYVRLKHRGDLYKKIGLKTKDDILLDLIADSIKKYNVESIKELYFYDHNLYVRLHKRKDGESLFKKALKK